MSSVSELSISTPTLTGNFNGQELKLHQLSVEEYDAMITTGVLKEDDNVELLNGAIIEKMVKGPKHAAATNRLFKVFYREFGESVAIRAQDPIWLDEFSEPEPDIVLAAPKPNEYDDSHPIPDEIYLILEVSESSLGFDRRAKGEAYARAGIQQYLILNIVESTVEDYREPREGDYQSRQTYSSGQKFNLVAFPEVYFAINDFLPADKG